HLGRVDSTSTRVRGDLTLAGAEGRTGEAVRPAQAVPVVDVEREGDGGVRRDSPLRKAAEPAVGWRAAAAAFRGVELEHRHAMLRALQVAALSWWLGGGAHGVQRTGERQRPEGSPRHAPLYVEDSRLDASPLATPTAHPPAPAD